MKRTVGVMTVAVMLCAQTGTYAADQMSKEREGSPSGQSGQDMQRQSGQDQQKLGQSQDSQRKSSQSGQSAQDMQPQSGQTGQSGQSSQSAQEMQRQSGQTGLSFSEEMQRQNAQIWQSGKQAQALCQKPVQAKQASSQPSPAGDQPKQAQASKDQSQLTPDQSKQQAQAGQQPTADQSKQQAQAGQQPTPDQSKQQAQMGQQPAPDQSRASGATQTIKGQFVRMEADFYVIKDQSGKETCIPTSYGTFVDQTFSPGDTIVARLGQDGNALLIGRPSDRQTASSSLQGQEMSQGTGDQRGDRGFSGSQQGSQGQGSGTPDQSMKSADKGLSGGQQGSQGQGSGIPDQSMKSTDKGFSGSQPGSQGQDTGARDQSKEKGVGGSQQAASVVKGELLKIQGEFYTVKDQSGSEVRLHVNNDTKMESAVSVGDKIEAERTSADHAISIKKAQDSGGSRNR